MPSRRHFLTTGALAAGAAFTGCSSAVPGTIATEAPTSPGADMLIAAASRQALIPDRLPSEPLSLESVELLRNRGQWFVRVRANGLEGLAVVHGGILEQAYPIFLNRVAPGLVGTNAQDLETTLQEIYLGRGGAGSNYKWQGLPFWVSVASGELAVLDLLGKATGRNVTEMLADGRVRDRVAVYRASSNRSNTAEEEVAWFQEQVEEIGAQAIKHRLGARMRTTAFSDARDAAIVPLMRKTFPDLTLYADANGSFDVAGGVEAGRLMDDYGYSFFEEPVPFDHYDETQAVTRQLALPVAGGEQESSLRQFLWMIDHHALDIVQPDIFYFGGLTRSIRVARAARLAGMDCTPHISGYGLGFLYAALFAACVENAGPHHEYKGIDDDLPAKAVGGRLEPRDGLIEIPTGPGLGVALDPSWVAAAETVTL